MHKHKSILLSSVYLCIFNCIYLGRRKLRGLTFHIKCLSISHCCGRYNLYLSYIWTLIYSVSFDSFSCDFCINAFVVYIGTVQYVCFVVDEITCLTVSNTHIYIYIYIGEYFMFISGQTLYYKSDCVKCSYLYSV